MRPVPIVRFILVAAALTVAFYLVVTPFYVTDRRAEVSDAFARLRAEKPDAAREVEKDLAAKGVPFLPDGARPGWLSPDALDVVHQVNQIEAVVRAYNRAVGEVPKEKWGAEQATKADIDARLLRAREFPMVAGYEQAVSIALILLAAFILWRLGGDVRREYRAIRRRPELASGGAGAITPAMARVGAAKLHADLGRDGPVDRERHPAHLVQAHHLLARFGEGGDPRACERVLDDEMEQATRLASARIIWVNYVIFAAPTLKLLATLRNMSEGLDKATNPENLPTVVGSIGTAFSATIVSLIILLPLMLWRYLLSARLLRLEVAIKDEGEGLIRRFRTNAADVECSDEAFWREPAAQDTTPDLPLAAELEPQPEPQPAPLPAPSPAPRPRARRFPRWRRFRTRVRLALKRCRRFAARCRERAAPALRSATDQLKTFGGRVKVFVAAGAARLGEAARVAWYGLMAGLVVGLQWVGEIFQRTARKLDGKNSTSDRPAPVTTSNQEGRSDGR